MDELNSSVLHHAEIKENSSLAFFSSGARVFNFFAERLVNVSVLQGVACLDFACLKNINPEIKKMDVKFLVSLAICREVFYATATQTQDSG